MDDELIASSLKLSSRISGCEHIKCTSKKVCSWPNVRTTSGPKEILERNARPLSRCSQSPPDRSAFGFRHNLIRCEQRGLFSSGARRGRSGCGGAGMGSGIFLRRIVFSVGIRGGRGGLSAVMLSSGRVLVYPSLPVLTISSTCGASDSYSFSFSNGLHLVFVFGDQPTWRSRRHC